MRVAFVGLGRMGRGMAASLVRAGHDVTVFNRSAAKAEPLRAAGARVAASPAQAAAGAQALVTMLADDTAVAAVTFGDGGTLAALPAGAVHVGSSTVSVALQRRLADAHTGAGQHYLAAPVFGRPEAAAGGQLRIVAAGEKAALDLARPALEAMGSSVHPVGSDAAAASAVKLAGNVLLAAAIEAMGETTALVRGLGVDPHVLFEIVFAGLFRAPIYESYGRMIVEGSYSPAGFALPLGLKDVRLALAAADEAGVAMPVASVVRDRFMAAVARGMGELDWAALGRLAAEDAGQQG
jgi:3-hydroxyisobutyrate dehydrogenase-like beta-hydroxyacid dehydrogenase